MAYSDTKILIGGLAHVPVLIFIFNLIKGKLEVKTEAVKETVVKDDKHKGINELLDKLDNIEAKADEVYEKIEQKKKDKKKKKKKKKDMKRD